MRRAGVLLLMACAVAACASVKLELGPGVTVTVPRTPRGWRAPLRDLDADYGKLHVTAGVLSSGTGELRQQAMHLASELAEQHDSEITWKNVSKVKEGRLEIWFDAKQENRRCKGVVAVLRSGPVAYAVTCFWPRTSRQAEIDAHRIVGSFRQRPSH